MADNLAMVAKDLGEAHAALTSIGKADSVWEGQASHAFQGKVGELPSYLDKAHRSLGDAAKVLHGWVDDLSSMQRTATDYERQAAQALQAVQHAKTNPDLGLGGQQFDSAEALQHAQARFDAAKSQLANATGELDEIRQQAGRLFVRHQELADHVADALRKAKDEAPEEPGFFDRIGEMFGDLLDGIKELASDVWDFIKDHADVIAKIGEVLSKIGNVLSIVAIATSWIPGVNAVTATAAAVVCGAAAGTKLLAKAAGADVSLLSIGMDALGAIPGGSVVAGAKNAVKQVAVNGARQAIGKGAKAVTVGKNALTGEALVVKPITRAALKENPVMAIQNAAEYTHANVINMANKLTGGKFGFEVGTTAGTIAGATVESVKGVAISQAADAAADRGKQFIEKQTGWRL